MLNGMGRLNSVVFKGVGPGGADIYQVNFEKASIDYRVWLSADGKVDSANMRPSDSPAPIVEMTAENLKPQIEEIDSMISADVARNPIGSVTAGIVSGKQLIWTRSYGDGDMEKKIPADADTVYRIGSITKCSPRLCWSNWLKRRRCISPIRWRSISGGQTGEGSISGRSADQFDSARHAHVGAGTRTGQSCDCNGRAVAEWEKTLVAALPHLKYNFEPGTRFSYSNIGYAILGAALSRAAGEPYLGVRAQAYPRATGDDDPFGDGVERANGDAPCEGGIR